MFSQLGPLFKTTFRQAEANDTRLHIPHNERDNNQKKEDKGNSSEQNNDLWEDHTSVTVEALKHFLINFLKTLPGYVETEKFNIKENKEHASTRPPEKTRPTNTRNAKAVRAYQAIAQKNSDEELELTNKPTDVHDKPEPTADLLKSQELRDIHSLIEDLDRLKKRNILSLEIQPAESFLESLKNAVKLKQSKN